MSKDKFELESIKPISGQEAFDEVVKYILGDDWYIVDPVSNDQANAIELEEIKRKWDIATGREYKDKWNNLIDKLKFK